MDERDISMADNSSAAAAPDPVRIGQRYQVIKALGQGGMARVYHVADAVSGRELALKQLSPRDGGQRAAVVSQFEAEFHALAQLSHPRVIEVYDYGLSEAGPFFTMELLDGGDLADRSPLPWREACALVYDICSSLALLHSRRFVHRDVSPRNVRCTRDGRAKLIDFGTMVPMGATNLVTGTPSFVAPEVLHRSALDGRTDLFSLGATLYYALTKRPAYPARGFHDLAAAWRRKPAPPSSVDPDIPPALDELVSSLLNLDPGRRPRTAYEVMQRLSAIAGLARDEQLVSQAYLWTPTLVAREGVLSALARQLEQAQAARGSACLLRAEAGLGRSRVLDACVLEAKARGAIVLRASASASTGGDLAVVQALADQLREARREQTLESASASELPDAFQAALLEISRGQLVLVAVDDMQRCDQSSASLLAALAARLERTRLMLVLTIEDGASGRASDAMPVLAEHCVDFGLEPLTRAQTEELLSSIFGTVPNLGVLTAAVHEIARGNPRKTLDVAQHLVDRGELRYADGSWTLPQLIDPSAMPRSVEDAMRERLAGLGAVARFLAEAHALSSFDSCSREDYLRLWQDADHQSVDRALLELLSHQILTREGSQYAIARHGWAALLHSELDDEGRSERHRALARVYEQSSPLASVRHLLAAGERALGLAQLLAFVKNDSHDPRTMWEMSGRMNPVDLIETFESAHRAALELDRPIRERTVAQGYIVALSVLVDDSYYHRHAGSWRARVEHDSGYTIYRELEDNTPPGERLRQTLTLLSQRYAATPEAERVYPPEDAIRLLVSYVGISIAIGSRSYDRALIASLPSLLEPFAPLSRVIEAIRLNAIATRDIADCRVEQARAGWLEVYERLGQMSVTEFPPVVAYRNAIAYAIGSAEARMGLSSAKEWAELLDRDPTQRVNARYLRKVECLNHGDFEGAERWRKQAEIAALQAPIRQMFSTTVSAELWTHAAAFDLTGVKQVLERIVMLAERYPSWAAYRLLAEAQFQSIRGDLEPACATFERCLALCTPDPSNPQRSFAAWPACVGAYVDTLHRLGRDAEARKIASDALGLCRQLGIGVSSYEITRGLALAEARLGDHAGAWARLEQLIEAQTTLGATGLQIGACYETGARIAIWTKDDARLQHYARLTAIEYRYGHDSPLGGRYERLMEEARQAGIGELPELTDFMSTAIKTMDRELDFAVTNVLHTMTGATDRQERAQRALALLCKARNARVGHLYLCDGGGLALVASHGGPQPPAGLLEFLERYMHLEDEACEDATSIADETQAVSTVARWFDADGKTHVPWLLTARVAGSARQIGIASVAIDDSQDRQVNEHRLCSAIAGYLVDAGDIRDLDAQA